jgi:hypothetical protein
MIAAIIACTVLYVCTYDDRILEEESHGILEGISSLHSWIKTQTMIRPTKLNFRKDGSAQ